MPLPTCGLAAVDCSILLDNHLIVKPMELWMSWLLGWHVLQTISHLLIGLVHSLLANHMVLALLSDNVVLAPLVQSQRRTNGHVYGTRRNTTTTLTNKTNVPSHIRVPVPGLRS